MALIHLQEVSLSFGGRPLFDRLDFQIQKGEKISLLGRNGCGKSTFMMLLHGLVEPDAGTVIRDKTLLTSLLPQEVPVGLAGSVYDVIAGGIAHPEHLHHHMDGAEERKSRRQIEHALSLLGLDPAGVFENLSAGMKRRVLLGRALAPDPDILLLDEPTNHLDIEAICWLEDFLARYDKTVFFVTHDRTFLGKVADRIVELDRARLFDWRCDYRTFLSRKDAWLEAEETNNALFDKKLAKEEIWIRKGIKSRRTRNEGRVRALERMREERMSRREVLGKVRMEIQKAEISGKMIIEADKVSFSYGENAVVKNFSARILRGDRIGLVGPNGCGKSTLIKLLLGELAPASGTVKTGTKIETAYFDQLRDRLDEERTVRQNVTDGNEIIDFNGRSRHVIGYLQDFLFTPDRADSPVKVLSGGERNRLLLAKLFTRPANLIVLDEPTNDLDIETIELLEELLLDYQGTLLLVSHDRTFLNNVVTATYMFEGEGSIRESAGGFDAREGAVEKPAPGREKPAKPARVKAPVPKTKLTFKEKSELESIPALIEESELRIKEIYVLLGDPSFYQKNGERVVEMKRELETLEARIETLYARWDELSAFDAP
ncbi:MAG: ATP-binding cassette domain-containing protein [Spirochaetes bacterium]|nr:MAG: ATP-binding cassette domain-containing protein [Spirochaetota bacterium]